MWAGNLSFRGWSWSAVFVGVIASLIFQALLVMIGFGLGLLTIDVPTGDTAAKAVSWAVFTWWAVSGVISAFVGGWVAANFSDTFAPENRAIHGLIAWALATIIVLGATGFAGSNSLAGTLGGPTATAFGQYRTIMETDGRTRPTRAQIDAARHNLALVMLGSFFALIVGAGAAVAGSQWLPEETTRGARRAQA
jgi:hypothetical protein